MGDRGGGLRGRDGELDVLDGLLGAAAGDPFVAVLEGEAGIGKSALLDEVSDRARRAGLEVVAAAAHELEQDRPFGPLADALELRREAKEAEKAELAQLIFGGAGTGPAGDAGAARFAIIEGIVDLLQRMGDRGPVLLAVEDLHFADACTLVTLGRIARSRAHLGVSIVCTTRPSGGVREREALLRTLVADGATELAIPQLDAATVAALVEDVLGAKPGPNLLARVEGAAGNPLYVLELVRALLQEGLVQAADEMAEVDSTGLPPSARLTILRRIGFLPPATLDVLRTAAVLGSAFAVDELAAATALPTSALVDLLRPAIEANLLVADGTMLRFRHDLIQEAAYTDLPEEVRASLHLEVARAFAAAGLPTSRVAAHYERSSSGPSAEASDALWAAGDEAHAADAPTALGLWEAAIDRTPDDHPDRLDRRVRHLFQMSRAQGVPDEALALALLDEPLTEGQRCAVEATLVTNYAEGLRPAEAEAIALARRRPQMMQAYMAGVIGGSRIASGDLAGAEDIVHQVLELGDPTGTMAEEFTRLTAVNTPRDELMEEVQVGSIRLIVLFIQGCTADALDVARRQADVFDEADNGPEPGHASILFTLADAGLHDEADALLRRITVGSQPTYPELDAAVGFGRWLVGDRETARTYLELALVKADETGIVWARLATASLLALVDLQEGDLAAAARHLAIADELQLGFGMTLASWARAQLAEAEGRAREALELLTGAWELDEALGMVAWQRYYGPDLARLALDAGDRTRCARVAKQLEALADLGRTVAARAVAWRARGLLEGDASLLVQAAEAYAAAGRPYDEARALEEAATFGQPDRHVGVAHLERALAAYEQLGAERDRTRAVRWLRDLGVQRRGRRTTRPTSGWESLTEAEARVVELIAERLTYREIGARLFISRRTVETHAANVFTKLGVRSKAELATAYAHRTT